MATIFVNPQWGNEINVYIKDGTVYNSEPTDGVFTESTSYKTLAAAISKAASGSTIVVNNASDNSIPVDVPKGTYSMGAGEIDNISSDNPKTLTINAYRIEATNNNTISGPLNLTFSFGNSKGSDYLSQLQIKSNPFTVSGGVNLTLTAINKQYTPITCKNAFTLDSSTLNVEGKFRNQDSGVVTISTSTASVYSFELTQKLTVTNSTVNVTGGEVTDTNGNPATLKALFNASNVVSLTSSTVTVGKLDGEKVVTGGTFTNTNWFMLSNNSEFKVLRNEEAEAENDKGGTVTNTGTMNVQNGSTLNAYLLVNGSTVSVDKGTVAVSQFTNNGTTVISNNGTISVTGTGTFENNGTIKVTDASLSSVITRNEETGGGFEVSGTSTLNIETDYAAAITLKDNASLVSSSIKTDKGSISIQSGKKASILGTNSFVNTRLTVGSGETLNLTAGSLCFNNSIAEATLTNNGTISLTAGSLCFNNNSIAEATLTNNGTISLATAELGTVLYIYTTETDDNLAYDYQVGGDVSDKNVVLTVDGINGIPCNAQFPLYTCELHC